jgi:hypothetical protein
MDAIAVVHEAEVQAIGGSSERHVRTRIPLSLVVLTRPRAVTGNLKNERTKDDEQGNRPAQHLRNQSYGEQGKEWDYN